VRKPVDSSSASVRILWRIWLLSKLNYSREVCHSAKKIRQGKECGGERMIY
jgi:hypothetical protein